MSATSDPIRVLWLTPDKPQNISVGRHRVADHLAERGFDVTLLGTTLRSVLRSFRERHNYDVVLGTTRAGAMGATLLGHLGGIPVVVDHIDPIRQFYATHPWWLATVVERLENATFRLADHVFYVYEDEGDRVASRAMAYSATDLGVEYEQFSTPDPSVVRAATARLDTLDLAENVVIYVGGLEPLYNVATILDAMDHLSGWSLVVAGTGSLVSSVERAANRRDDVEFLGVIPHDQVPGYLRGADVGLSLVDDPHTLKVLEYLAAGVPVVQLDGRARDRFGDHVTYCSPEAADVARAIEDANERAVTETTKDYVRRFTWSSVTDTYESAIRRTLSKG